MLRGLDQKTDGSIWEGVFLGGELTSDSGFVVSLSLAQQQLNAGEPAGKRNTNPFLDSLKIPASELVRVTAAKMVLGMCLVCIERPFTDTSRLTLTFFLWSVIRRRQI